MSQLNPWETLGYRSWIEVVHQLQASEETKRLLSLCNTENQNVHAENLKLWNVVTHVERYLKSGGFYGVELKEALDALRRKK